MFAAIEFDMVPYLALSNGHNNVEYYDQVWTLDQLISTGPYLLNKALSYASRLCSNDIEHLFVVLPDKCDDWQFCPMQNWALKPKLHIMPRSAAIIAGLRLLDRDDRFSAIVLDINYYETSTNVYCDGGSYIDCPCKGKLSLMYLLRLFATRIAEQPGMHIDKDKIYDQARELLWSLYQPARKTKRPLPLPQEQIDEICAKYARGFSDYFEEMKDEIHGTGQIVLIGGGARILAPWLLPEHKQILRTRTAREFFLAQAAMVKPQWFLLELLGSRFEETE